MTREERIDWLCRLRCWVVAPPLMTAEQKSKFIEALTETIEALQTEQNAYKEGYDACKRIVAREKNFNHYCPKCMGKLEPCEDCISRQAALDIFGLSEKSRKYGGDHSGYDTIMLYEVQDALEALPSVQPEPFINKPCVSEQACHEDKMKVLGKIKEDIEAKCCITVGRECDGAITLHDVFEIIDKYKAESEDKE